MWSLPFSGGEGGAPARRRLRFRALLLGLDFWSINDHAEASTPRKWRIGGFDPPVQRRVRRGDPRHDRVPRLGVDPDRPHRRRALGTQERDPARSRGRQDIPRAPDQLRRFHARRRCPRPPARLLVLCPCYWSTSTTASSTTTSTPSFREIIDANECPDGVHVRELPVTAAKRPKTPGVLFREARAVGPGEPGDPARYDLGLSTRPGCDLGQTADSPQHDPQRRR